MSPNNISPEQFRQLLAASASVLGRFTGPELFFTQSVALAAGSGGPVVVNVPRTLNINRPISDIFIKLTGRLAVTVANYTSVSAEGWPNLLQRILVQGTHKDFGNLTPINMTGATQYMWTRMFQPRGNGTVIVNGSSFQGPTVATPPFNGITEFRQASGAASAGFAGSTAGSPYDFVIVWRIPVGPSMGLGQDVKRQSTNYVWTSQDWGDTLQLQLTFGDASSLGDITGATTAFTAFGSGAGSPQMSVHLGYTLLTQFNNLVRTGVCIRSEQPVSNQQTALATGAILQTLQKQITTNLLVKTGTIQTAGLGAGVDTLATLSDTQLDRTQIQVDNKPVRNNQDNTVYKAHDEAYFGAVQPQGYFMMSFVEGQNALLAYRGDGLSGGAQFQLVSDCISASANNRQRFVQEMIYGGPFPAQR
jgi:hypothetical protein